MGQEQSTDGNGENFMASMPSGAASMAGADLYDVVPELRGASTARLNSLATFTSKRIGTLRNEIKMLSSNGNQGFVKSYKGITAGQGSAAQASLHPNNVHLNRYTNIVAYDHSRVVIQPKSANFNCDYINANWIPGFEDDKYYIATQGPIPASIASFWQMVWESRVHVIVMVTNEVEGDKLKCHRYWPNVGSGPTTSGEVTIEVVDEIVHATYVERHMRIASVEAPGSAHDVVQLAYTAWPDHGVPATTKEMLNFRRIVHDLHKTFKEGPLLTHCSAGVGRTGTFIGLDRFLTAVLAEREESILAIVEDMRSHRNMMVQSQIQFVYLYLACLDGMERLASLLDKELAKLAMSPDERQELELQELTSQLEHEEEIMGTIKLKRKTQKTDARHMFGGPTDDVDTARNIPALKRKESLVAAAQRKASTVSAEERGYYQANAPNLEARLEALVVSRDNWQKKYESAQQQWEASQTGGGTAYDVDLDLSPLESRIQSLANAQEAFDARKSNPAATAEEVAALESLAGLTARLESLRTTIVSDEQRWRKRGHGFAQQKDAEPAKIQHTVDMLGSLFDRVKLLQTEQDDWRLRVNKAYEGEETFKSDIASERSEQERREQERRAREEAAQAQAERELEEKKQREQEAAMLAAAQAEEERKKAIKARMKTVAATPPRVYDPQLRRKSELNMAEEEARKKREEEAAALAKQQAEEARLAAAEEKRNKSVKKANRFLSKITKK